MLDFITLDKKMINDGIIKHWESPQELEEKYKTGSAYIKVSPVNPKEIIGFVALWETGVHDCMELGSLWVETNWEGKNVGTGVFADCCKGIKEKNLLVFLITNKESVRLISKRENWIKEIDPALAYQIRPSDKAGREVFYFDEKSQLFIRENFSKLSP